MIRSNNTNEADDSNLPALSRLTRRRRTGLCPGALLPLLFGFAASVAHAGSPVYPLSKSANGRYLVDAAGAPFLMVGDAPMSLVVNLNSTDAASYLSDRKTKGFNTVEIDVLCTTYTGGRADGSMLDGTKPFTATLSGGSYNLGKPNSTYFAHVDAILNMAASDGLLVMLSPIETGGWTNTMVANGSTACRAYGQFLGNRYKSFPNILWISGNDYDYPSKTVNDPVVTAVALGIKDNDTVHLHTVELGAPGDSLQDPNWAPIISLSGAYDYSPPYDAELTAYNRANFLPVFLVESHYELESVGFPPSANNQETGTPLVLRHQEYWTMLSGCCGQLYGNHYTWTFASGWQSNLDTTGVAQLQYVTAFFKSRPWMLLVPDQNHTVMTAGYGTYATTGLVSANDYSTTARTADGGFVIAYVPTVRTVTVDMSQLNATAAGCWYDPSNGTYALAAGSPFTNAGLQNFTPPGANSAGDGDWVLLLQAAAAPILTLTPKAPDVTATVAGLPGIQYTLQVSSNLASWATLSVVSDPSGTSQFTDSGALTKQPRFYRVSYSIPSGPQDVLAPGANAASAETAPAVQEKPAVPEKPAVHESKNSKRLRSE